MQHTHQDSDLRTAVSADLYRDILGPGYQVSGVAIRALENTELLWTEGAGR